MATTWRAQVALTGTTYLSCLEQLVEAVHKRVAEDGVNAELVSHVNGFLKSQTAWWVCLGEWGNGHM